MMRRGAEAVSGFETGTGSRRCGAAVAPGGHAVDARQAPLASGAQGTRRVDVNWAWATGSAHYDWMDHAPLFDHRD
ncbi:hypothetical protein BLA6993_00443 [Burkholderia lata]|nr:hypothetical protein BLA6993_00443 [Burkholderia lata]